MSMSHCHCHRAYMLFASRYRFSAVSTPSSHLIYCVPREMQNILDSNVCRLCGLDGRFDIWEEDELNIEVALSEKIFQCVEVQVRDATTFFTHRNSRLPLHAIRFQVRRDDDSTKICQQCRGKINDYFNFRNRCTTRNINYLLEKMSKSMKRTVDAGSMDVAVDAHSRPIITCETHIDKGSSSMA